MNMQNGLKMSSYKNGNGDTVTLYQNEAGYAATIVCGDVSLYSPSGDLICGATDQDAAIQILATWTK